MEYKRYLKNFICAVLIFFVICMATVAVIDPFFHYHRPLFGLKAVLTDKEYQCIGTIKNFDYDSLIVGSSVCENYNDHWFDEKFSVKAIKAVRSYGATADLCYFVDEAFKKHDLKYVFYNIDPGSLAAEPKITFEETGCPMYLYDNNPVNDIEYLLNKDVIIEKIPYMVTKSYIGDYDEGNSYNWGQWKEFNADMVTGLYIRASKIADMKPEDTYDAQCEQNILLLEKLVKDHPDTDYIFFVPPYSFVWWDNIYRDGDLDAYIYNMKKCADRLLRYDNARFFYFLTDENVVTDLNNYMDVLHFSPRINRYITDELAKGGHEIFKEDTGRLAEQSREFADRVVTELIVPYEDILKTDTDYGAADE